MHAITVHKQKTDIEGHVKLLFFNIHNTVYILTVSCLNASSVEWISAQHAYWLNTLGKRKIMHIINKSDYIST